MEEDGEWDIEHWQDEESVTPNEVLNIQMVLSSEIQQTKIQGMVVGNDNEWGKHQELVEQLRQNCMWTMTMMFSAANLIG